MQPSRLIYFCTCAYFLHAYILNIAFSPIFPSFNQPTNHLWPFVSLLHLLKSRSPSKLACFILLATWWRRPVPRLCKRKNMSGIRLLRTNPLMGPTLILPKQLACTVISQRPRSMAMFIVGRWKESFSGVSFSRWQSNRLKSRHIQFIALGGTIGTGLFLGIGKAFEQAGPLSLLLGYTFTGVAVFAMVCSLILSWSQWIKAHSTLDAIFRGNGYLVTITWSNPPVLRAIRGWSHGFRCRMECKFFLAAINMRKG